MTSVCMIWNTWTSFMYLSTSAYIYYIFICVYTYVIYIYIVIVSTIVIFTLSLSLSICTPLRGFERRCRWFGIRITRANGIVGISLLNVGRSHLCRRLGLVKRRSLSNLAGDRGLVMGFACEATPAANGSMARDVLPIWQSFALPPCGCRFA